MKQIISTVLTLSLVLSLAVGFGGTVASAADSGEPVYGGSATIFYKNFNEIFDPAMNESYTYGLWLESLWGPDWGLNDPSQYNFDANVLPLEDIDGQIAKEWNWVQNGDGTSDLFVTIRDDIYFQEKEPEYDLFHARNLTAEDVKYSYDRIWGTGDVGADGKASYEMDWTSLFNGIIDFGSTAGGSDEPTAESGAEVSATFVEPVEVLGDYDLVFHLCSEAESRLESFMFTQVNITGPEWDTLTDEQKNDWHYACGTGPFVLVAYEPDSYYRYERNPNYYDFDERHPENRLPYLDSLTLTAVNDAAGIMSSFIAGNLDYISLDANLTSDQNQQIIDAMGDDVHVLNFTSNAAGIALKVNQEPFNDERVRIALQKAINLEEVNAAYYDYDTPLNLAGLWLPLRSDWSAIPEWSDELKDEYTYDPEEAEALLDEAGYPREEDGTRFTFTLALDTNADQDLYQLIKAYFAAIGVTMELEPVADMQTAHQISGNPDDPRLINQNIADVESVDGAIFGFSTTGMANATYHTDTEFDEMLANAQSALTNEEQAEYARQADLRFSGSHWVIACSGTTLKHELLSTRIGGLDNGERISYSKFTKSFLARIWVKDAQ